jgi:hypothetical protein
MAAIRRGGARVDEMSRYRHNPAGCGAVESAVRVAGGVPTLGGGVRVLAASAARHVGSNAVIA